MKTKKSDLWFVTKRYGWGWTPATWQGWVIVLGYIAIVIGLASFIGNGFDSRAGSTTFTFLVFLLTVLLLVVCYAKGETPRWRWGK